MEQTHILNESIIISKERRKKRGKALLKGIFFILVIPFVLLKIFNWYYSMGFLILISLEKIIKIKRRKYFVKDVYGNKLGVKQFFKRWKEGIEGITPLQQARTNVLGTLITLIGIVSGMIINALVRMENIWWWVEIILAGSLILVSIQMIGGLQKYWRFKEIEKVQKELERKLDENIEVEIENNKLKEIEDYQNE